MCIYKLTKYTKLFKYLSAWWLLPMCEIFELFTPNSTMSFHSVSFDVKVFSCRCFTVFFSTLLSFLFEILLCACMCCVISFSFCYSLHYFCSFQIIFHFVEAFPSDAVFCSFILLFFFCFCILSRWMNEWMIFVWIWVCIGCF